MPGLDDLGWLQFERLCTRIADDEAGLDPTEWTGTADRYRGFVTTEERVLRGRTLAPGTEVRCAWLRREPTERAARLEELRSEPGVTFVNASGAELDGFPPGQVLYGEAELLAAVAGAPELRLAMPCLLGLLDPPAPGRSTLDVDAARALAAVFVGTGAWERTLRTLRHHGFAVLSGPPEMGKTALARVLGLALLHEGWEVHECAGPDDVWERLDPDRPQLFIADDAFGAAHHRPDAAERWAGELDRLLRATGEETWIVWTSRPAPLHAGLPRLRRERGAERFPAPGEVRIDAAELSEEERALLLFRHARAAGLTPEARERVRRLGGELVAHPHFTPERIRRFVACGADPALPTEAMAASYEALEHEHRELLLALLDSPPGPVAERDLAAALRRHASTGLPKAPVELVGGLSDHFLRVTA